VAADRGEQGLVGWFQLGSWELAAKDGELVAENKEFQILGSIAAGEQGQELDGAAQGQVGESGQHAGWPPQRRLRTGARYRLVMGTRSSQAVPHFPHPTRFLRSLSLDELPTLWSALVGKTSLFGLRL
jgi:hypothetical protein